MTGIRHACVRLAAALIASGLLTEVGPARPDRHQGGAPAAPATPSTANVRGTGVISGVVVDAITGEPIPGAVVAIESTSGRPIGQQGRQITDRRGRFIFVAVPASPQVSIAASKAGYLAGDPAPGLGRVSNGRLAIADGEWIGNVRMAMSPLGSIAGDVVDEAGEPVVGATVRVIAIVRVAGHDRLAGGPIVRTDDRGRYRAANLLPGRYLVAVPSVQAAVPAGATSAAPAIDLDGGRLVLGPYPVPPPPVDGRPRAYPVAFHPAAVSAADASRVEIGPGDRRDGVVVRLAPQPAVQVSGRVEGPAGAHVGLSLRLLAAGLEDLGAGLETATALVDAEGAFRFAHVPAGAYTIEASGAVGALQYGMPSGTISPRFPAPGTRPSDSFADAVTSGPPGTTFLETTMGGERQAAGRVALVVGDTDLAGVIVRLAPAARIAGRVQFEFDPRTRRPARLPSVHLRAEPADGSPWLGVPQASTDRDDPAQPFELRGLGAGRYVLRLAPGSGFQVKSVSHAGRDHTDAPFDAATTPSFEGVVVTVTNVPTLLTGAVRDAAGAPAPRARVVAFAADRARWTDAGLSPPRLADAQADDKGTFQMSGLPDGDYFVVAVPYLPHADWRSTEFLDRAAPVARQVSIRWGQSARQDLVLVETLR